MNQAEFDLINALASQLQHFVDGDGLQQSPEHLKLLLDVASETLAEGRKGLIRQRDFGHSQSRN